MKIFRTFRAATARFIGASILAAVACTSETAYACEFRTGSTTGSVAFGVLDPITAPNATAAIQLDVRCAPAGDWAVAQFTWTSINGGASTGRLAGGTPPYGPGIAYSVNLSVSGGGANRTLTVTLQIAGSAYVNANAGSYSDVLTLMVTP